MQALSVAGLLRDVGQAQYEMHPLPTSYLRSSAAPQADPATREPWTRAFVDVMGTLADGLAPRPLHEQRGRFHVHGQNFYNALEEAERLDMAVDIRALTQSMASFSLHSRNFADASRLFERRLEGQGRLETRNVRRPLTIRWEWLRLNSGTLQRRKVVSQIA